MLILLLFFLLVPTSAENVSNETSARFQLIANTQQCGNCLKEMSLVKDKSVKADGFAWRCSVCRAGNFGFPKKAVRDGSFFEYQHLPMKKMLYLAADWIENPLSSILEVARRHKVNKNTVVKVHELFRQVTRKWFIRKYDKTPKEALGGPRRIVEIDESLMYKAKYNRGRMLARPQVWVFGLTERGTKKTILIRVKKRDANTLLPIIAKYVAPGSLVVSDGWAAYGGIRYLQSGFSHQFVNHKVNFVDPSDRRVHTQTIEATWGVLKRQMKARFGDKEYRLEGHLFSYMFRRYYGKQKLLNHLILEMKHFEAEEDEDSDSSSGSSSSRSSTSGSDSDSNLDPLSDADDVDSDDDQDENLDLDSDAGLVVDNNSDSELDENNNSNSDLDPYSDVESRDSESDQDINQSSDSELDPYSDVDAGQEADLDPSVGNGEFEETSDDENGDLATAVQNHPTTRKKIVYSLGTTSRPPSTRRRQNDVQSQQRLTTKRARRTTSFHRQRTTTSPTPLPVRSSTKKIRITNPPNYRSRSTTPSTRQATTPAPSLAPKPTAKRGRKTTPTRLTTVSITRTTAAPILSTGSRKRKLIASQQRTSTTVKPPTSSVPPRKSPRTKNSKTVN